MGYTGTAKWIARPAASVALRYGLSIVSIAAALVLSQLFLGLHVDSGPSLGTRIDAWVPAMMLASARDEVARGSETV